MSSTGYLQYTMRTVVHCAAGSIVRIPALFDGLGAKRILLMSDAGLEQAGIVDQVVRVFGTTGFSSRPALAGVFTGIAPDAACDTVNEALRYAREISADAILALGGGSVMDAAKGVKYALHHNLTDVRDAIQVGIKIESWPNATPMDIPHIAVPTTAGTGAEVTPGAVLYNEEAGIKGNLAVPFIEADIAVLDPNLTLGLPAHITASTGMDALTHALETVASPNSDHFTDAHAFMSAQLIERNLPTAVNDGQNVAARSSMLQASTMACNAFINALHAMPVHNCAHAFGAMFHIPHGDANAVLLPIVMEELRDFYLPNAERLSQALNLNVIGLSADEQLDAVIARLRGLLKETGQAQNFARFKIPADAMESIVIAVASDPVGLFLPIPPEKIVAIATKAMG